MKVKNILLCNFTLVKGAQFVIKDVDQLNLLSDEFLEDQALLAPSSADAVTYQPWWRGGPIKSFDP